MNSAQAIQIAVSALRWQICKLAYEACPAEHGHSKSSSAISAAKQRADLKDAVDRLLTVLEMIDQGRKRPKHIRLAMLSHRQRIRPRVLVSGGLPLLSNSAGGLENKRSEDSAFDEFFRSDWSWPV